MIESMVSANTFVVRFRLERSNSGARWRGSIKHIPSGEHCEFLHIDEMIKFFQKFQINFDEEDQKYQTKF